MIRIFNAPDYENDFSQNSHRWFFWTLCTELMWSLRFPEVAKDSPQESLILYFFLAIMDCLDVSLQITQISECISTGITFMIAFFSHELLWYDFSNSLIAQSISHNDHICNFFLPSWTTLIWFCKCSDRVKYLAQESHLWSLWPP